LVLSIVFCVAVVPLLLLTIGLYLAARSREDRLMDEEEDARLAGDRAVHAPPAEE